MSNILHNRRLKDVLDRFAALVAIILAAPIFLIIAIILKLKKEDVFFAQERVGLGLNTFRMLKFTTMLRGSEIYGSITTANDSRVTLFGKLLRQTKLNEIPQLINILKGEMSFVGPRPLPMSEILEYYSPNDSVKIYSVKPGITGVGSLEFSDEENLLDKMEDYEAYFAQVIMPKKATLELWYVDNWSILLDLAIVAKTIFKVFVQALEIPINTLRKKTYDSWEQPTHIEINEDFGSVAVLTVENSSKDQDS